MDIFDKLCNALAKIMYYLAGLAILILMLLSNADILSRLFYKPIPGTFEFIGYLGLIGVSLAMAETSIRKGHVQVSFLVDLLPKRVQGVIESITGLIGFFLFAAITSRSFLLALDFKAGGYVTPTTKIPFYHFVFGMAFGAALVCLVILLDVIRNLRMMVKK